MELIRSRSALHAISIRIGIGSCLLGIMLTACSAWLLAVVVDLSKIPPGVIQWSEHVGSNEVQFLIAHYKSFGSERAINRHLLWTSDSPHASGQRISSELADVFDLSELEFDDAIMLDARGWPCSAFSCVFSRDQSAGWRTTVSKGGIQLDPGTTNSAGIRAIPLRPLWRGFIINALFYSSIVCCIGYLKLLFTIRIRKKRGQCIICSYNLRGDYTRPCAECGFVHKL